MINVKTLEKKQGSFQLQVRDVSLYPGVTLLLGSNGAGKSTLLRLLSTTTRAERADVSYDGMTVSDHLPFIRSRIGYVPTKTSAYGHMTVRGFLNYMAQLKSQHIDEQFEALMETLQLTSIENCKIRRLSQGQKQKVILAQAFIGNARYVLLDEPLMYLDIEERNLIIQWIGMQSRRTTFIIATHELNEWTAIADHILYLHNGSLIFSGAPQLWTLGTPEKVWEGLVMEDDIGSLSQYGTILHTQHDGMRLRVKVAGLKPPDLPRFTEIEKTLEDAYFLRQANHTTG